MYKTTTRSLSLLVSALLICSSIFAQSIWPGDLSNNGQVNGVDYLFWGYSHQAEGPKRVPASTEWAEQRMGTPWAQTFPSNHNFAYGDANGDGRINPSDAEVIGQHFQRSHGSIRADDLALVQGIELTPIVPVLLPDEVDLSAMTFAVDLVLTQPLENMYGFTFSFSLTEDLLQPTDGVLYNITNTSFLFPEAANIRSFVHSDLNPGTYHVTVVKTDGTGISGEGSLGKLILRLRPTQQVEQIDFPFNLTFGIPVLVDHNLDRFKSKIDALTVNRGDFSGGACPSTIDPVCGNDGRTYLNSCYAEAAGVMDYTAGTCFDSSCIDPHQIDSDANCATVYDPVCGCNEITYTNQCAADAAGVLSTTPGPCATTNNCYDPQYVVTSSATTVNDATGVITVNCPSTYDPVCACNGVTYTNACLAEASGIRVFTAGSCESVCVDPADIDPYAVCTTEYDPVCGCNGVTYTNPCRAEAAGLQTYTYGSCSGSSAWCEEAIPVQCGDFLPYETTIGAGNNIVQYPGCTSNTFYAPDRVYVIEKTTIGDLQIGLEITTPGLDLDLFLLGDNCSQITCLAKSTTNNSRTNNEGIVYEDAPLGTYYIVVDGQHASSAGDFRLEVSCGYLYCGDAVPIQCGTTYWGTNLNGTDDVSLYTCGNTVNVENNGPEVVHTFTTTQAGPVTITLSGLHANLELFLLDACDRGACLKYSQNPGNSDEYITDYLPAGTYYVVVDGYNGAVSEYDLHIDCTNACDLAIVELSATASSCGQSSGSITLSTSGGTPNYLIHYSGPRSGSFTTSASTCRINYLPPGIYTVTKTDALGCTVSGEVAVLGGSNLSVNLSPHDAVCMSGGRLGVYITNGQAPYTVRLTGPSPGTSTVHTNNFTINDLDPGDYTIYITDYFGCSLTQHFTIGQSSGDFLWNHTVTPAVCGGYGAIHVNTYNGIPPYNVVVRGPINGGATVNSSSFNIINLPGGTYQVTVEDGNWCQSTRTIVVPTTSVHLSLTADNGICGADGSIGVSVSSGSPAYQISWTGPESGTASTGNNHFTIPSLSAGTYTVQVTDHNGCTDTETITLNNAEGGGLNANVIPLDGACGQNGALWVDIYNGMAPYTISWSGPENGSTTTYETNFDVANLACGTYHLIISDANGCSYTQTVVIGGCDDIQLSLIPENGICGQAGSILVSITGGSPVYIVNWTGPESGQTTTATNSVNLAGLPAGTYSVTVTGSGGCSDYAVTQVSTSESNLVLQTVVSEAICGAEGSIGLSILGGVGPYQISWTGPESGVINTNNSSVTIGSLVAGTYQLYVTDGNGCNVTKTESIQNTGSNLNVSLVGNDGICSDFGNIGVNVFNGQAPFTINYTGPITGSYTTNGPVSQIASTPAGTYTVAVIDANGCSTSGTVQVNVQNNLVANLTPVNGQCDSPGSIQVFISQGQPGFRISWTNGGEVNGTVDVGSNAYTITGLPTGNYSVYITDQAGCARTLTTAIDNGNGNIDLSASLIYNDCGQYNTIWVDVIGGTPPYTVTWVETENGTENGTATHPTSAFEIFDLPPGTYKVTVVDANGCMAMQPDIIIYPAPIDIMTVTPFNGVCGEDGSLQVAITGGTGPYTLTWNGPSSGTQNYQNGTNIITNLPSGTYTLTLVDVNGCTETETVTLTNGGSPLDVVTALIYNDCGQYNTIWVDVIGGTPPFTVTWIETETGHESGTATHPTGAFEIYDLPPGTYKVTVVDANGCMDMEQDIIIYPSPINIFTATPQPGVCGENGKIDLNVIGGTGPYTLTYSGPISGTQNVPAGLSVLTGFPSGTYTLTLTDANGCTEAETVVLDNTQGSPLTVQTSLIYNDCGQYNTIWVDVVGGTPPFTVTWTGGENGSMTTSARAFEIMDLPPGTYKVTVTDVNGCMDMEQDIIIYPAPVAIFNATATNGECGGPGTISVNVTAGTAPYTLQYAGPISGTRAITGTSFTLDPAPTGTYTLTLTDASGCTEVEQVLVSTSENDIHLTATGENGDCVTDPAITAQASGGDGSYTLTWTGPENGSTTIGSTPFTITHLQPGTYILVAEDGGCSDTEQVTVAQPEDDLHLSLTPTPGSCGSVGRIGVSIAGGSPDYQLSWSGPSSGNVTVDGNFVNIPNLNSGTYTVLVTDSGGCTDVKTTTVQNSASDISLTATAQAGQCGTSGSINLTLNGGNGTYQVNWSGPSSGARTVTGSTTQLTGLLPGTYHITASSAGCSTNASVVVGSGTPALQIHTSTTSAGCAPDGSILVNLNGNSPYQLSWSGPISGNTTVHGNSYRIEGLIAGSYNVSATDANGCTDVTQVLVSSSENDVHLTATGENGDCVTDPAITAQASGGDGSYTLTWTGPENGSTTIGSAPFTITHLQPGTYTLVAEDGACSDTKQVTVAQPEDDLHLSLTPTPGSCGSVGRIGVSIAGGSPDYQVSWSGPSSGNVTIDGSFVNIPNLTSGTYTVLVTDSGGCTDVETTTVQNSNSDIGLTATAQAGQCGASGSINLTLNGGNGTYQVNWSGPSSGARTVTGSTTQLTGLLPGTYQITASSAGCSTNASVVVGLGSPALQIFTSTTSASCAADGSIAVSLSGTQGSTTLSWSGPENGSVVVPGSSYVITGLPAGTYTLSAVSGICSDTKTATVGGTGSDVAVTASPVAGVCGADGSLILYLSGGSAPYQISWSGAESGSTTSNSTTVTIPNLRAGNYHIQVSSGACTATTSATVTTTANNLIVTATPQAGSCLSDPAILVSLEGGAAPYQLSWSGPGSGNTTVYGNSYRIDGLTTGHYSLNVIDANGCQRTTTVGLTDEALAISLSGQDGTCGDNTVITVSISNGVGPYTITWYGEIEGYAVTNQHTYSIFNLPGGAYQVTVEDINGCTASSTIIIESGVTDFYVWHTAGDNGCGALGNIWMNFYEGQAPYRIEWIGPESGFDEVSFDGYDVTDLPGGYYTIIVTDGAGCVDVQYVEVINVPNDLAVTFTPQNGSCGNNGSIGVYVTGGTPRYTVSWYRNGAPVSVRFLNGNYFQISELIAGNYLVLVEDEGGCERRENFVITTEASQMTLGLTPVAPGCNSDGSIGVTFGGGQAPFQVQWTGAASGSASTNDYNYIITGLDGGNYTVTVTSGDGCSGAANTTVYGTTRGDVDAAFSYQANEREVQFINESTNGLYVWNFGDGNTLTTYEEDISHTYASPGTYRVCLRITESCDTDLHCETITIASAGTLALLDIWEGSGGSGSTISLPVTLTNADNIVSLSGSVNLADAAVGQLVSVTPGVIAPQFNAANNTFSFFSNGGSPVDMRNEEVLFYFNVQLTGNSGQRTAVRWAQQPLPIEIGTMVAGEAGTLGYTTSDGEAMITDVASLRGVVNTFWGEPLADTEISIVGPAYNGSMMTDENGAYDMPNLTAGTEYTVGASRAGDYHNGLSTYALFIGQRFLLGMEPAQIYSPYQVIAGDANCNDAFTTLDLFLIQRLIIGAADEFSSCSAWTFVSDVSEMPAAFDAYNVFPYVNSHPMMLMEEDQSADFVGVKTGDILGAASVPGMLPNGGMEVDERGNGTLTFQSANPRLAAGEEVTLYFSSEEFEDIVSYQFGLQFAAEQLELLEFLPATEQPFQTVVAGDSQADEGKLRLSWFSLDGEGHTATSDTPLFGLRFRALDDIEDFGAIMRIDQSGMRAEAYDVAEQNLRPELAFNSEVTSTDDPLAAQFVLYQNVPNPANGETLIGFYLPEATTATVTLRDAFGKVVWSQTQDYLAGQQQVKVDGSLLPAGVYHYSLQAESFRATKSLVVVR